MTTTQTTATPGNRRFYGWYALAGVMLTTMASIGAVVVSFGVFLPTVSAEFGWSRAAVATGLTLGLLCNGLLGPLWGSIVTKFGPRASLITGGLLITLGMASLSLIQQPWHIYVFYSIAGLGSGLAGMVSTATVANNWFTRKRSLAMSLIVSSGCVGGFVFPPLVTVLIASIGWRLTWVVLAGIILVLSVIIGSIILVRNRPEDIGQHPDGEPPLTFDGEATIESRMKRGEETAGWSRKKVLGMSTTWLIAVFSVAYSLPMGTINTHQVAYVLDLGFSPMIAATTMSLLAVVAIVGSMSFGALAMKFKLRYLATICFGLQIIGLVILLTTQNLVLIYVYVIIFGLGNGALIAATPTFIGAYYGRISYARVMGIIAPFQIIPQAGAAILAGAIYDASSSYASAFLLITVFSMAGLICAFLAKPPQPQPTHT